MNSKKEKFSKMDALKNKKHKMFVFEYINNGQNATKAYLATYPTVSRGTAGANGHKLLNNAEIKEALREYFDKYYEDKKKLAGETLRILEGILKSDISNVVEHDGRRMKILNLDEIQDTSVIQSIEHSTSDTSEKQSVKMYDKLKAAEVVAKITNILSDKQELSGTVTIIPAKKPKKLTDRQKKEKQ